jgi:hypothetical protein
MSRARWDSFERIPNSDRIGKGWESPTMPEHSKRSIEQYYSEYPEHDRLSSSSGQLEFERTKRIVLRFLPNSPATIADIGAGTGHILFGLPLLVTKLTSLNHPVGWWKSLAIECKPRHLNNIDKLGELKSKNSGKLVTVPSAPRGILAESTMARIR